MSTIEIKMPQLGESVTEGVIANWLVKVGDKIAKYDPVAEVMSDKVVTEIPASEGGTVQAFLVPENEPIPVGTAIMTLASSASETTSDLPATEAVAATKAPIKVENSAATNESNEQPRYSPAVLSLAQAHQIDLSQLVGTGRNQRITRKDVQNAINQPVAPTKASVVQQTEDVSVPTETVTATTNPEVKASSLRQAIAATMLKSVQEIPQAWTMIEVDVTELVGLRNQHKTGFKAENGYALSYFPFFVKAVAQSLKRHKRLNSSWQNKAIIQYDDINLGIAVATEDALFVPVIQHADRLSIAGIASEINRLAKAVKSGNLKNEEMQHGTFTVNNTGSFGSVASMGIINPPQAGILQVETIRKELVVSADDQISIRSKINLCLTLDHRVLDGLAAGQFLGDLKQVLESYDSKTEIY